LKSDYGRTCKGSYAGGLRKGDGPCGSVVPGREKEQRGEEGEGGKHEGLKPADAEEAGVFLNGDIG